MVSTAKPNGRDVDVERRYFGVEDFLREVKRQGGPISRGVVYEGLRRGTIPSVRIGRRYMIPADALDRMLARR